MRRDVFVQNDSGGMSIMSSAVVERVIDDGREDDEGFARRHEVILGSLVGDDSFIARVVAGEPLTSDEASQWIARYRTALEVPCGKLLVCGGYDPDVLGDWVESGESGGVGMVEVPPGKYLVDVHTYLHSMNGRVILEQEWEEKLGAWFRRDHPDRAFPAWVAGELAMFEEEDPGHEKEWRDLAASVEKGLLAVETDPLDWVGFLIHLQPFDPALKLDEPEDGGGWFGAGQGLRRPMPFPLGVPAIGAVDPEYRQALSKLVGGDEDEEDDAEEGQLHFVDVFSRLTGREPLPIEGGPVEVSPRELLSIYRLAWFGAPSAHPELRVECRDAANQARLVEGWSRFEAQARDGALHIRMAEDGRPAGILSLLRDSDEQAWTMFPEGSLLELATCSPRDEWDPPAGLTRFRGPTRGRLESCLWEIREAYPAVSAATLREAVELSRGAADGQRLVLRSEQEAREVLDHFMARWEILVDADNRPACHGREIRQPREDATNMLYIAASAFRLRYSDVWACVPDDEEDDE